MKPSWDDAPPEAMWLAQDQSGTWEWYRSEPKCYMCDILNDGFWADREGCTLGRAGFSDSNEGWDDSAEPRP